MSDDADYMLRCENDLIINSGYVDVWDGSRVVAWSGSRVDAWDGSRVDARSGSHVDAWNDFQLLADDGNYELRVSPDGYYYAGCRIALTAEEALKHWDRDDDRACLFTLAIGLNEGNE